MNTRNTILGAFAAALLLSGPAFAQTTTTTTRETTVTTDQAGKIRTYVQREKRPSVKLTEEVRVGGTLPTSTEIYSFPADVGVTNYRYTIVNDRTVLVDPSTRRVIQVIE